MKTLIKNGTVVNSTGTASADVLIDGETVFPVKEEAQDILPAAADHVKHDVFLTQKMIARRGLCCFRHKKHYKVYQVLKNRRCQPFGTTGRR